jgi:hypothetical protein
VSSERALVCGLRCAHANALCCSVLSCVLCVLCCGACAVVCAVSRGSVPKLRAERERKGPPRTVTAVGSGAAARFDDAKEPPNESIAAKLMRYTTLNQQLIRYNDRARSLEAFRF